MREQLKALSQETFIYGTSTVVGRFLNFLLVPFYVVLACHVGLGLIRGHGLRFATPRPAVIWLGLGAIILFGVLRNLPWF